MARKPQNFEWVGFTDQHRDLLTRIDFYGNNGWARNSQSEAMLPALLGECAETGLTLDRVIDAMRAIGYGDPSLHMLVRWESKRTTGNFGK